MYMVIRYLDPEGNDYQNVGKDSGSMSLAVITKDSGLAAGALGGVGENLSIIHLDLSLAR